jgi:hypothetical protein
MGLALGLGEHPATDRLLRRCLSAAVDERPADGAALVAALAAIA